MTSLDHSILTEIKGRVGLVTLHRPSALNALNVEMISHLSRTLDLWRDDSNVSCVVLQGVGQRAFCAGGDLRSVYEAKQRDDTEALSFLFREEYRLNYKIHMFPKPYISFLHGYTMGGGLGISVHGSHRIVCEGSCLAMPEVTIGYFPDVGAGYFLNQCPGFLGMYLALTGIYISAEDAFYARLATHYVRKENYQELFQDFCHRSPATSYEVEEILGRFQEPVPVSSLKERRGEIDRLFGKEQFDDILRTLEQEKSEFSDECLKIFSAKSSSSLKVTFELLKRMRGKSLREALHYDFLLAQKFGKHPDFFEGIRAAIIDKDQNPQWQPKTLDEVTQNVVEEYFVAHSDQKLFD